MAKQHYKLGVGFGSIADGPAHVFRVAVGEPFAEHIGHVGADLYAIGQLDSTPAGELALAIAFTARPGGGSPLGADTVPNADYPRLVVRPGGRPIRWAMAASNDSFEQPDLLVWLLDKG